jgi:hypothetical protein
MRRLGSLRKRGLKTVSVALRGFWWLVRLVTRRALDHRVDPEFLIANCVASYFTCKRSGPLAARPLLRQRYKSGSPVLDERDHGAVFTRNRSVKGAPVFPMHAMNPAPAVIAASLVCGSWQTATSAGSLALGCWYNGTMRCTRRRLYGLSGKDQQELVARIEAFYRNGWPGIAISGLT